jgi:hypothetical protein
MSVDSLYTMWICRCNTSYCNDNTVDGTQPDCHPTNIGGMTTEVTTTEMTTKVIMTTEVTTKMTVTTECVTGLGVSLLRGSSFYFSVVQSVAVLLLTLISQNSLI